MVVGDHDLRFCEGSTVSVVAVAVMQREQNEGCFVIFWIGKGCVRNARKYGKEVLDTQV